MHARFFVTLLLSASPLFGADWPMWRADPARSAESAQKWDDSLNLLWAKPFGALTPAYRDERLQFDAGYEPIAFGGRVFFGSSRDHSVRALDAESGELLWQFFTEGPVRCAPVGGSGRLIFGSDDGWVYCVRASTGDLVWKHQAVPSDRKLIGNGKLISVWPVRGGPVLQEGRVYFAAGVWPLEGVFVTCLDAATGELIWRNEECSFLFGSQPHNTEAFSGIAPQGYLLIDGEELVVPCSNAYPARLDLKSGELLHFELPSAGRLPGGWFAASRPDKESRRGTKVVADSSVNRKRHEGRMSEAGEEGVRDTITVGGHTFNFADGYGQVPGEIYSAIAADGKLIISTREGWIYCFGQGEAKGKPEATQPSAATPAPPSGRAVRLHELAGNRRGFAVVFGEDRGIAGDLSEGLDMNVVQVNEKPLAERWSHEAAHQYKGKAADFQLPPYFAGLIVIEDTSGISKTRLREIFDSLRPYGGVLDLPRNLAETAEAAKLPGASFLDEESADRLSIRRETLEGATNYLADWKPKADALVSAPLGILWFGDQVSHFKRAPQPLFVDGVMISVDKDWTDRTHRTSKVDYRLLDRKYTDVYTGRPLSPDEVPELAQSFGEVDQETIQPSKYRPPSQKGEGFRLNPLTGEKEAREIKQGYGCDGGFNYGKLFTLRSGTATFYDLTYESGPIGISGPRSGCTNSLIPANGVLNVPYFYEGCTCSYPLPAGLSLYSMPERFEQWMAWGEESATELSGKIQRLGLNLGAPGDRRTRDGTLWLDFPSVGGPSPEVLAKTEPTELKLIYRHSLWMNDVGEAWPWVAGSGATNLRALTISGFKPGTYRVRLTFGRLAGEQAEPVDISIQGEVVFAGFDLSSSAEVMGAVVKSADAVEIGPGGELAIQLSAPGVLSGIEVLP